MYVVPSEDHVGIRRGPWFYGHDQGLHREEGQHLSLLRSRNDHRRSLGLFGLDKFSRRVNQNYLIPWKAYWLHWDRNMRCTSTGVGHETCCILSLVPIWRVEIQLFDRPVLEVYCENGRECFTKYSKLSHSLCECNTIVRKMALLPTRYNLVSALLINIEHFLDEGLSCDEDIRKEWRYEWRFHTDTNYAKASDEYRLPVACSNRAERFSVKSNQSRARDNSDQPRTSAFA